MTAVDIFLFTRSDPLDCQLLVAVFTFDVTIVYFSIDLHCYFTIQSTTTDFSDDLPTIFALLLQDAKMNYFFQMVLVN